LAAAALLARVIGLGHVSFWLDEILGTLQVAGPLDETWAHLRDVRVHPPLWGLLNWAWLRVTEDEALRRALPILFGTVAVVILAALGTRWFGRRVGLAAGLLAAVSPLHVRYSQELRAYSLGLLALLFAVWAGDRALEKGGPRRWAVLSLALFACFASLYVAALALVPILGLAFAEARPWPERRRQLARAMGAAGVALLGMLPWFGVVGEALRTEHELPARPWDVPAASARWQFLSVGGIEGEPSGLCAIAFAGFTTVGAWVALRSARGRVVLVSALATSLGVECVLRATDHWSNGRYWLMTWPFLVLLAALGCVRAGELAARLLSRRVSSRLAGTLPAAALGLSMLAVVPGLARYYTAGRSDWASVADTVLNVADADPRILVGNEWTRVSLGYYVSLASGEGHRISERVAIYPGRAGTREPAAERRCQVLVQAGGPGPEPLDRALGSTPASRRFPRTRARMSVVARPSVDVSTDPWVCGMPGSRWETPERQPPWRTPSFDRSPFWLVPMDGSEDPALGPGWLRPWRSKSGTTLRWVTGRWVGLQIPGDARFAAFRIRSRVSGTLLRVFRNRRLVLEVPLSSKMSTVQAAWSAVDPGDDPSATLDLEFVEPPGARSDRHGRVAVVDSLQFAR
jgi:mannosyltransferase